MHNYIFETFEKNEYGYFTNQLDLSQIHTVKSFKRYRNFKWEQVARILYNELAMDYRFSTGEERLILNILTTAIDKPNMAMKSPNLSDYCIDGFNSFLRLIDKLEEAKLVKRLINCTDENGLKKCFVFYPTICPHRLLDILDTQESQILMMKNKVKERTNT